MGTRVAAPAKANIKPAFLVTKLEGKVDHTLIVYNDKNEREEKIVKEDAGYMVTFPIKGASMRVRTDAELRRLGFDRTIPLINEDGDDDEAIYEMPNSVMAAVKG